jgi:hypothetical protein
LLLFTESVPSAFDRRIQAEATLTMLADLVWALGTASSIYDYKIASRWWIPIERYRHGGWFALLDVGAGAGYVHTAMWDEAIRGALVWWGWRCPETRAVEFQSIMAS